MYDTQPQPGTRLPGFRSTLFILLENAIGVFRSNTNACISYPKCQTCPPAPLIVSHRETYLTSFGEFRSEEHTSELKSLMRISYAVFCGKKKTNNQKQRIP